MHSVNGPWDSAVFLKSNLVKDPKHLLFCFSLINISQLFHFFVCNALSSQKQSKCLWNMVVKTIYKKIYLQYCYVAVPFFYNLSVLCPSALFRKSVCIHSLCSGLQITNQLLATTLVFPRQKQSVACSIGCVREFVSVSVFLLSAFSSCK